MAQTASISNQELLDKYVNKGEYLVIVGLLSRPGIGLFLARLEHEHFRPDTPLNEWFQLHIGNLGPMKTFVAVIPASFIDIAEKIADEVGLRLTNNSIFELTPNGMQEYPIHGVNVRMVENKPGHWVYNNNPSEHERMMQQEHDECQKIFDDHAARFDAGEFGGLDPK